MAKELIGHGPYPVEALGLRPTPLKEPLEFGDGTAKAAEAFADAESLPVPYAPPMPDDEARRLEQWQKNELRWLASRAEELERRLLRRTIILGCSLAATVGAAAGLVFFSLPQPARTVATLAEPAMATPLPPVPPEAPPPAAISAEMPAETAPRVPIEVASVPMMPEPAPAATEASDPPEPTVLEDEAVSLAPPAAVVPESAATTSATTTTPNLRDALATIKQHLDTPAATAMATREPEPAGPTAIHVVAPVTPEPVLEMSSSRDAEEAVAVPALAASGTATPANHPSSGLTPSDKGSFVVKEFVNLRAAPSNGGAVLAVIEPGSKVQELGRQGNWLQVRHASFTGWVHGKFLGRSEGEGGPSG